MRFKTNLKFFILLFFCINFQFSAQIDSVDIYLKSNQSNDKILTNVDRYLINNLDNYNYLISSGEKLLKFSEIVKSDSAKLLGYYYIGYGLDGNQNFEPAVKNYYLAMSIAEKQKNLVKLYNLNNFLGIISSLQGQHKKSIYLFRRAEKYSYQIGNLRTVAVIKNNIAIEYGELKQFNLAVIYFNESLKISNKINFKKIKLELFSNLLENYIKMDDKILAKNFYDSLTTLISSPGYSKNFDLKSTAYTIIGYYLKYVKNYDKALIVLDSSITILKKNPYYDNLKKAYKYQSEVYELMGKDKEALATFKLYIDIRDTLTNSDRVKNTLEFENNYNNIKTQLELVKNKKDNEIKRLKLKRNNLILISLSSIVIILVLSLFLVFRLLKLRRKDLTLLKHKNQIIEEKQTEILSSIRYAKRIQDSFLASEKYIQKKLRKLKDK